LKPPSWWLPCFDLSTEFHYFVETYRQHNLEYSSCDNSWIIKPSRSTRGKGHRIVTSGDESGLQAIAAMTPKLDIEYGDDGEILSFKKTHPDHELVAQKLILRPLLVFNRKFDLRVFVFVRSFVPFEGLSL
jgi:hypothetical protein